MYKKFLPKDPLLGAALLGGSLAILIGLFYLKIDLRAIFSFKKDQPTLSDAPKISTIDPPIENWTTIGPTPKKHTSPTIMVNKNISVLNKNLIFTRLSNPKSIDKYIKQILTSYLKVTSNRGSSSQTNSDRKPPTNQNQPKTLQPIFICYNNWDNNINFTPKLKEINDITLLEVLPLSDNMNRDQLQTRSQLRLVYKLPRETRGHYIAIKTLCQNIPDPEGTSNAPLPPKIDVRLINNKLKIREWKKSFLTTIPQDLIWTTNRLLINSDAVFLEIKVETSKGNSVLINPILKMELAKTQ